MEAHHNALSFHIFGQDIVIPWMANFVGVGIVLGIFLILSLLYKKFRHTGFFLLFDSLFEKVYTFFEEILGKEEKKWIKSFVVTVFFVILFSNLIGLTFSFLAPIFGQDESGYFILKHYVGTATTDLNFNIVMAVISVLLVIFVQFSTLGFSKFFYEYFPVFGKGYVPYEFWKLPKVVDYPLFIVVKCFDIILSVFLGLLEIIGLFAKVISLSFRLFGNMTAGTALLAILIAGLNGMTNNLFSIDFPVIAPLLLYAQETLIALIQAFVFPLLVAIFIKVARAH